MSLFHETAWTSTRLILALLWLELRDDDGLVAQLWRTSRLRPIGQRMPEEVGVVALLIVCPIVRAAALFAGERPRDGCLGALDQVAQFDHFHQLGVKSA